MESENEEFVEDLEVAEVLPNYNISIPSDGRNRNTRFSETEGPIGPHSHPRTPKPRPGVLPKRSLPASTTKSGPELTIGMANPVKWNSGFSRLGASYPSSVESSSESMERLPIQFPPRLFERSTRVIEWPSGTIQRHSRSTEPPPSEAIEWPSSSTEATPSESIELHRPGLINPPPESIESSMSSTESLAESYESISGSELSHAMPIPRYPKTSTHDSGISSTASSVLTNPDDWGTYRRKISKQPQTNHIYRKGNSWKWFKSKVLVHVLTIHILLILFLFGILEYGQYAISGSPKILVLLLATILALSTIVLMYSVMLIEPGAMPVIELDLRNLQWEYFLKLALKAESLPPHQILSNVNYMGEVVAGNFCPTCKHFKPIQTIHCDLCGHCIARYDHHCIFFGCCIGLRNFKYFYLFQWTLSTYYLLIFASSLPCLEFSVSKTGIQHGVTLLFLVLPWIVTCFHSNINFTITPYVYTYLISKGKTAYETYYYWTFRYCKFEKVVEDKIHNDLVEKHCKKKGCLQNWRDYVFRKAPKSCIYELPIVFDYESGDTEPREPDSESSQSSWSPKQKLPLAVLPPISRWDEAARWWRLICCCFCCMLLLRRGRKTIRTVTPYIEPDTSEELTEIVEDENPHQQEEEAEDQHPDIPRVIKIQMLD